MKLQDAQGQLRRIVRFFGWGILPGFALPVLVLAALSADHFAMGGDSAQERLAQAENAVWRDGNPSQAMALYESILSDWPGGPLAGEAHAGMAFLLEESNAADRDVAQAYSAAARLNPEHLEAGDWLIRAGEHWRRAGDDSAAQMAYSRSIARHAESSDKARLALANLQLSLGEIDLALEHYQEASKAKTPTLASIGRMGVSVCYERMGNLDAALAELDEDSWSGRRKRLFERRRAIRQ
jgi:tetratricopeptide (TPR) repeat protein